jgi:hypothetical protein
MDGELRAAIENGSHHLLGVSAIACPRVTGSLQIAINFELQLRKNAIARVAHPQVCMARKSALLFSGRGRPKARGACRGEAGCRSRIGHSGARTLGVRLKAVGFALGHHCL